MVSNPHPPEKSQSAGRANSKATTPPHVLLPVAAVTPGHAASHTAGAQSRGSLHSPCGQGQATPHLPYAAIHTGLFSTCRAQAHEEPRGNGDEGHEEGVISILTNTQKIHFLKPKHSSLSTCLFP